MQLEVPQNVKKFLDLLSQYESVEEELLIKQALKYGVEDLRREFAVKLFAENRLSIGEGAELANLSVGEYMELLASRGIKSKVTLEDYREGLKHAEEMLKGEH